MLKKIKDIAPGRVVRYRDTEVIVLEHRPDGTLVCTKNQTWSEFGSTNNFAASSLRDHLNGDFLTALTKGNTDELVTREVDLTALNGSKEYGSCACRVAPLTFDEVRRFHGLLPKPESWEWSVTPWSTPCVDEDSTWVMGLCAKGSIGGRSCSNTGGTYPAFLLLGDVMVDDLTGPDTESDDAWRDSYIGRLLEMMREIAESNKDRQARDKVLRAVSGLADAVTEFYFQSDKDK